MLSNSGIILMLLVSNRFNQCFCNESFNVFNKIKSGFKLAGEFFSSDHATKVANLVSEALGAKSTNGKSDEHSGNIFSGFLRLFGFESRQINAIAVNAIILLAQLIGTSLIPISKIEQRNTAEGTPYEWMLKNNVVSDLISDAKEQKLSDKIIEYLTERSMDEETGCIQLLICKIKPFITEMQRAITERGSQNKKGFNVIYNYFPNASVIAENGDRCEKKYVYCTVPL